MTEEGGRMFQLRPMSIKNPAKVKYVVLMVVMVALLITSITLLAMHKTGNIPNATVILFGIFVPAIIIIFGTGIYASSTYIH